MMTTHQKLGVTLYHGGMPGLWVGDIIYPGQAERRYVHDCPTCRAQQAGHAHHGMDPATPPEWVYATSDRVYARYYASRALGGTLYRVQLEGDIEPSMEDPPQFPTWRGRQARVVAVLDRRIQLTHTERRSLFIRWGGTADEYADMIQTVLTGGDAG